MKKAYILLGALVASGTLMAQSPTTVPMHQFSSIGKYDANGITVVENRVAANADRATYYSANFDVDFEGWTPATEVGSVDFKLTSTGHFNNPGNTFIIPNLASSTPTQWIIVDSDGDGTSYANPERTSLTSPVIDLSPTGANAPANVKLEFEQFFAEWGGDITDDTEDSCFVGITTDGGATWDEVEINVNVGRDNRENPEVFQVNIADWIVGGESTVQIRFRWAGAWNYGWQIDNVTIVDLEEDELASTTGFLRNIKNPAVLNQVQYAQVPLSQAHELTLGTIVKNLGYNEMTGVGINYRVLDGATVLSSGTTTTENLASLAAGPLGESDTVWYNTGWTPTVTGDYQIEMVVFSDAANDDDTSNDTILTDYRVTDYVYAREMAPATGFVRNSADNADQDFKYGTMYEIFADTEVQGITIVLDSAVTGDLVYVELMKYNGTDWDFAAVSDDHSIEVSDVGNELTLLLGSPVPVVAGELYLAMYGHYGSATAPRIQTVGSDFDGNFLYDAAGTLGAFIGTPTPKVRLNLDPTLSIDEVTENIEFSVYPNPVANELTVAVANQSQGTTLTVRDIAGQLISTQKVTATQTTVNTAALASGIYFVEVSNGTSSNVQKFTKK
jgi:hypothetical protein